jgi:hypothetical protein
MFFFEMKKANEIPCLQVQFDDYHNKFSSYIMPSKHILSKTRSLCPLNDLSLTFSV